MTSWPIATASDSETAPTIDPAVGRLVRRRAVVVHVVSLGLPQGSRTDDSPRPGAAPWGCPGAIAQRSVQGVSMGYDKSPGAMRNRRLAYALIAQPCDPEIDQARLTYRHAISCSCRRVGIVRKQPSPCNRDGQRTEEEHDEKPDASQRHRPGALHPFLPVVSSSPHSNRPAKT